MDTMYDRLGKLLSETLEAGVVKFVKIERDTTKRHITNANLILGKKKTVAFVVLLTFG